MTANKKKTTTSQRPGKVKNQHPRKVKKRRCDFKVETKEGRLLKYLRESRNLSVRKAGKLLGVSESSVCHAENGRKDLTPKLIEQFLIAYGYERSEFDELLNGVRVMPDNLRRECLEIVKRIEASKLKSVKVFLDTFAG